MMSKKKTDKHEQTQEELLAEIRELRESLAAADSELREAKETVELQRQDLVELRLRHAESVATGRRVQRLILVALHTVAALGSVVGIDAAKELGDGNRT